MPPITRALPAAVGIAAVAATLTAVSVPAIGDDNLVFNRSATFPVYENLGPGQDRSAETVAEISDVTDDAKTLVYTDAPGKRIGFVDIRRPSAPRGLGTQPVDQDGDAEAEPTSLVIAGNYVLVAVNTSKSFKEPSGRLDVIELKSRERVRSIELGGQPDSIALSADGKRGIVAIENERDEDAPPDDDPDGVDGDLPQKPAGFVSVLELKGKPGRWKATAVKMPADAKIDTPSDPEPEYVTVNRRGKAAVTLQENNGIAIVDLARKRVEKVFTAGRASVSGIDTKTDGRIDQTGSIKNVPREPDSIAWVDDRHVATANEGDWKGGTRGWSIFNVRTGKVVFDSKNSLDRRAIRKGLHNEQRASKKGPEPEGLAVATMKGRRYGFVGSERSNFVAVYDLTRPTQPTFLQMLPTTNGPEGITPIPERGLLAVSSEVDDAEVGVRSTVALYRLESGSAQFPNISSANDSLGNPIGWSALGALSAKPGNPSTLYTASDNALAPSRILTVDVRRKPARITTELPLTENGKEVAWDIEGISARPQGGFWVAVEGASGSQNALYRTDATGAVQERVALPADVAAGLDKWGLEGVSARQDRRGEVVYVALQRPLVGESHSRIGRYNTRTKQWSWFAYPLESTTAKGDWIGLSELTVIGRDKVAVIERDKLNGPAAKVKRIYTVELPEASADTVPVVRKTLAIDLLPFLRATNGWTQEKTEGMAITDDGTVYVVTDNDALVNATGETVFGKAGRIKR